MEIYFDGVLVNTDYYAGLTKTATVFEDSFRLGKTICETYKLTLDKSSNLQTPSIVTIYQNEELFKTLYVDNVEEDDLTVTYDLVDAMVKFNFAYDASLIMNEETTITLLDIFNDICLRAGIQTEITDFNSSDMEVTWFDNSLTARTYLGYIAELNSSFLVITPDNKLAFKNIVQTPVKTVTFDEISDYKIGSKHEITRVVFDNTYNYWVFGDETGETYYIDTTNVYLTTEEQVEKIYNTINGFTYYNFKSNNLPIYDLKAGDLVRFTDGTNNYDTFTQYDGLNFSGNRWFGGLEINVKNNLQEETEIIGEDTKIKAIKVTVDRNNNQITTLITETQTMQEDLRENYYTLQQTNELIQSSATGLTNTFSEAGGNNIFRNTGLWFEAPKQTDGVFPSDTTFPSTTTFPSSISYYEYWTGHLSKIKEEKASNMTAIWLLQGNVYQTQQVPNGNYTISFKYKKLIELADVKVVINDVEYTLNNIDDTEFLQVISVTSKYIKINFYSNIDGACEIYDLMVNAGSVKLAYSQNQNETTTDTVNISKGITITSSNTETVFKANADGIRTLDRNDNVLTEFTDTGMITKKMVVEDTSIILGTQVQEVGGQTWFTRL